MFEKAKPSSISSAHQFSGSSRSGHDVRNVDQFAQTPEIAGEHSEAIPLRAIEWSELTARFSAARDLRQLLRADMGVKMEAEGLAFADAASQFFRASEEDERAVNPNALEACKTSSGIGENVIGGRNKSPSSADHHNAGQDAFMRPGPGDAKEEQ